MAEVVPSYDELQLRIQRGEEGGYQVVAFGPDGSTGSGSFSLPFDETQLDNFVSWLGSQRGVRAYRSSQMEDAKRFDAEPFQALVRGEVRDVYLGPVCWSTTCECESRWTNKRSPVRGSDNSGKSAGAGRRLLQWGSISFQSSALLRLRLGGWVQFDAVLAYEPVVLKATGDCVESGGVLETELFGRVSEGDPGLIDDQGKKLVTASTRASPMRA